MMQGLTQVMVKMHLLHVGTEEKGSTASNV